MLQQIWTDAPPAARSQISDLVLGVNRDIADSVLGSVRDVSGSSTAITNLTRDVSDDSEHYI